MPLALPVIIAGIRTATVWIVGTATLSTPVGATSLGNYIFSGLQTQNFTAVIVGCIAAASLAIVLDQLIRLMEVAASRRSRTLASSAGLGLVILLAAGLLPLLMKSQTKVAEPVVVGAKTFTEQYILAELLKEELNDSGFEATTKSSLGSTIIFDALVSNHIDCYVDYSGTLWTNIMKRSDLPPRAQLLAELKSFLSKNYNVTLLGTLGFENTYALALRKDKASEAGIGSMEELARKSPALTIGSDYEFFSRPEWASLRRAYNLRFAGQRTFDPSLMYAAIKENQVDVISAYSTDGRIIEYNLVTIPDPKQALPPYDAVLLLSPKAAANTKLVNALRPFVGSINDNVMRTANKMVDIDEQPIEKSAVYLRTIIGK